MLVGDSSGYIVNRLLVPYLLDGIRGLEEGLRGAPGHRHRDETRLWAPDGPLALADLIRPRRVYAMARTLYAEHHDRRYSPPAFLRRLVLASQFGKKTAGCASP